MDPWALLSAVPKDSNYAQIVAAKKALSILSANGDVLLQLCLACADNDVFTVKELLMANKTVLNTLDQKGVSPLIYAICFHHKESVELLLNFNVDVNEQDKLVGYTPVMWATHFDYDDILERLVSFGADPLKKNKSGLNALDLAKENSKAYEYYKIHGYLASSKPESTDGDFYMEGFVSHDNSDSQLNLKMENLNVGDKNAAFVSDDDIEFDDSAEYITFNFNVVLTGQYIKFNSDSITPLLNYAFQLQKDHPNRPLYPSAIIFQCMRYAESRMESPGMVKNLLSLYLAKVRKVTDTTSGFAQFMSAKERKDKEKECKKKKEPLPKVVDIMAIGYWIAALNHLYYFLYRDSACDFFTKYPDVLQELVSCLQLLISKLAFSIDERLELLIEPCILQYNSVPDINVAYKNDWKIFKNKNKQPKTSFEEIIDVLYPPSLTDQMKPSPIKIIQTLGALLYVMELYHINDVIKQQCLSSVLFWLGTTIFNSILESKKYCSRVKAMEIRLNISYIQDWLRVNNLHPYIDKDVTFSTVLNYKDVKFPDNLSSSIEPWLMHVCRFGGNPLDPTDATFYYNSLFNIGRYCFQPVLELTEWLQVLSSMPDEATIQDISQNFECLNSTQMVQCVRNYNYEIDEHKFSKSLKKWLKEFFISPNSDFKLFYKDYNKSPDMLFHCTQVFPITLPNMIQLLHQYGSDFDHVDTRKFIAYQPNIPYKMRDDIELIIDENSDLDDDEVADVSSNSSAESNDQVEIDEEESASDSQHDALDFKTKTNEELDPYKTLQAPKAAQSSWRVEEENPWA